MEDKYSRRYFRRRNSLNLKLNDYENEMLRLKCEQSKMNKSEYLREVICGCAPAEAPPKKFYTAVNELNKIGVNINQIAARANATGYVSDDEIKFLHDTADEIFDRLTEIKKIVKGARPYGLTYYENLMIKQREARKEGKPEPQFGDTIVGNTIYKNEDEEDDTEVEVLYETAGADVSEEKYDDRYDVNSYYKN